MNRTCSCHDYRCMLVDFSKPLRIVTIGSELTTMLLVRNLQSYFENVGASSYDKGAHMAYNYIR
jgi:hypothetical protein